MPNVNEQVLSNLDSNIVGSFDITPENGVVTNDYLKSENDNIQNIDTHNKLLNILNIRKKMLEVNLERNDVKNKIIYTLFSLMLIIIILTICVHNKFSKF